MDESPSASHKGGALAGTVEVTLLDGTTPSLDPIAFESVHIFRATGPSASWQWWGTATSDARGVLQLAPTDLGTGPRYRVSAVIAVTGQRQSSEAYTAAGAYDFVVGSPPITIAVRDAISGAALANESVTITEVMVDGSLQWRQSATTDTSGEAAFVLGGAGQGSVYRARVSPYGAGVVWSGDISMSGLAVLQVGSSPVTLTDGATGAPIAGVRLTAYRVDGGQRSWYKEGHTDAAGVVRFDFEALASGASIIVRADDPLGDGVDPETSPITAAGPVAFVVGAGPSDPSPTPPPPTPPAPPPPAPPPAACALTPPTGQVYHVAVGGGDWGHDGSSADPWATISHAIRQVPDGSTILVGPGTYGTVSLAGHFTQGVLIRAATPYTARLRGVTDKAVKCYSCSGITIEGFDIAHAGPGVGPLVVQIQGTDTSRITLRGNIIHDSYNNDLLKINNGASHVTIERNMFYNQHGSDEHMDINSVTDVVIQDNVLFNDFAASGRVNGNDTSSYIVIKDSNGSSDGVLGARDVIVRRNVFASWQGGAGFNFVLLGEDGAPYIEARDITVENNLFLGNTSHTMRAPFGIKSAEGVLFSHNTIIGDLPASAFAMRMNVENSAIRNDDIHFYNNVWSDPTGTMNRFSTTPHGQTASFVLDNNLYWNGGAAIPERSDDLCNRSNDAHGLDLDPRLPRTDGLVSPAWNGTAFADGSSTICEVFQALVVEHGTPAAGSPVIDAARAGVAPDHDILGRPRGTPDLGAVER